MIPHAFGQSEPFTVGIEEELFCLDGETLAPQPFPREALDGARLKEELFASVVELNTGVHRTVAEAVEELRVAARSREGGGGRGRLRSRRGGYLADRGTGGAAGRREPGVPQIRPLCGSVGPAPVLLRPPRPRGHGEPRGVHGGARGRPALAAAGARALRQLAVRRGRGHGAALGARRDPRAPAAERRAAGVRRLRGVGAVRRAARRARARRRHHPCLVGRASASSLRHARDPGRRPADAARDDGRARVLCSQAMVARLEAHGAGRPRSLRAEPLGRPPLRARGGAHPSRRTRGSWRRPSSWPSWPSASARDSPACRTRPTSSSRSAARRASALCAAWSRSRTIEAWPCRPTPSRSTGIRCERCVMRLGAALEGLDGLEAANANLMGRGDALLGRRAARQEGHPRGARARRLHRRSAPRNSGDFAVVELLLSGPMSEVQPETDARGIAEEARARVRFEEEVLDLADQVYRVARRLVSTREEAEDLVQETYARAFRSWRSYTPGTNLRAWLFRILTNLNIDRGRREQRTPVDAAAGGRRLLPLQPARGGLGLRRRGADRRAPLPGRDRPGPVRGAARLPRRHRPRRHRRLHVPGRGADPRHPDRDGHVAPAPREKDPQEGARRS